MNSIPYVSLGVAAVSAGWAWRRRDDFGSKPYLHWFLYLHLSAIGLHQFEEYGWPGGFRDAFVRALGIPQAAWLVPSNPTLQVVNAFGLTVVFGLLGWWGTRVIWIGLGTLFINFANGFFHLTQSVVHMAYMPGTFTGTFLYLPLGLLAARFASVRGDVDLQRLMTAFALGTAISFLPFFHVWMSYWLASY